MASLVKASVVKKLDPAKTCVLVCDIQERFRDVIMGFESLVKCSAFVVKSAGELKIPVVATEQYPKAPPAARSDRGGAATPHRRGRRASREDEDASPGSRRPSRRLRRSSRATRTRSSRRRSSPCAPAERHRKPVVFAPAFRDDDAGAPTPRKSSKTVSAEFGRARRCTADVKAHLQALGVESAIVCGLETHVCVLQTTLDLLEMGLDVHARRPRPRARTSASFSRRRRRGRQLDSPPAARGAAAATTTWRFRGDRVALAAAQRPTGSDGSPSSQVCADAVSSQRVFDRSVALARLAQAGAVVATSESVVFQLLKNSTHASFKAIAPFVRENAEDAKTSELQTL